MIQTIIITYDISCLSMKVNCIDKKRQNISVSYIVYCMALLIDLDVSIDVN